MHFWIACLVLQASATVSRTCSSAPAELAVTKLDALIRSIERGGQAFTAAEPRADMHPDLATRLGIDPTRSLSGDELAHLLAGERADGETIEGASRRKTISFVDCCFSADKSVSLAWAFAPTEAERNQIVQAHRDAVQSAMVYVSTELGRARKGDGGKGGSGVRTRRLGPVHALHLPAHPGDRQRRGNRAVSLKVAVIRTFTRTSRCSMRC